VAEGVTEGQWIRGYPNVSMYPRRVGGVRPSARPFFSLVLHRSIHVSRDSAVLPALQGLGSASSRSLRLGRFASGRLAAACFVSVVLSPWAVCATPRARYGSSARAAETHTSASLGCDQKTASWIAPGANEKAAVLDAIADQVADAIWADLTGHSEGYGWFPTGKAR